MKSLLIIPTIIFITGGFMLIFARIRILLKKEVTITSRNTRYWVLSPLIKSFMPGAYDPDSFHLRVWMKTIFGLLFLISGCFTFIAEWQIMILASGLSFSSEMRY